MQLITGLKYRYELKGKELTGQHIFSQGSDIASSFQREMGALDLLAFNHNLLRQLQSDMKDLKAGLKFSAIG